MDLAIIVVVLAIIQYIAFGFLVGWARGKYDCPAPAATGKAIFERYNRVHMNTLEQIPAFLTAMFLYSHTGSPNVAAGLGIVFIVGRFVYLRSYIADPKSRGIGFGLTTLPVLYMLLGSLFFTARNMLA